MTFFLVQSIPVSVVFHSSTHPGLMWMFERLITQDAYLQSITPLLLFFSEVAWSGNTLGFGKKTNKKPYPGGFFLFFFFKNCLLCSFPLKCLNIFDVQMLLAGQKKQQMHIFFVQSSHHFPLMCKSVFAAIMWKPLLAFIRAGTGELACLPFGKPPFFCFGDVDLLMVRDGMCMFTHAEWMDVWMCSCACERAMSFPRSCGERTPVCGTLPASSPSFCTALPSSQCFPVKQASKPAASHSGCDLLLKVF